MTGDVNMEKRWLKAEMHAHCNMDPEDHSVCRFTPKQLIREAGRQSYKVLSITCHDLDIWTPDLAEFARNLGITLIPGMEVTVEKTRHILVYNSGQTPENLNTLEKIRASTHEKSLVIAPHPFYPGKSCLRGFLENNLDLFDAIEYSGFLVRGLNFNHRGVKLAENNNKTIVGFGDVHYLWQLGKTYTMIYAEPNVDSVIDSIKRGFVQIVASPLSWSEAAGWWIVKTWRKMFPADLPPAEIGSDKIKDGRRLGTPQQGVESQRIHIGQ